MEGKDTNIRYTGAVYTPIEVASSIVERCLKLLESKELTVLEPSVGDGAFLTRLVNNEVSVSSLTAIDINGQVIQELSERYYSQSNAFSFIKDDFIEFAIEQKVQDTNSAKFNLIVGNPPFIRRHNFSDELKESLDRFSQAFSYPLNKLKNTWPAFLIASSQLVTDDGVVALVLPYELLTVEYGQNVLNHIQQEFERVDVMVSKQKAFKEIDQDAIVLIAQKKSLKKSGLYITKVADFEKLSDRGARKIQFETGVGSGVELNSYLLPTSAMRLVKRLQSQSNRVSDFLTSSPGVVSAANDFFIRSKADIAKLGLTKHAKPILKKGSFSSSSPIFTHAEFERLAEREPCFLLHIEGEPEHLSPSVKSYIKLGEEQNIHLRYKCRNRRNWYQVPLVEPQQAFLFKRSHSHPRVLLNEAGVYTTDTAYGLRLKEGYTARGFCFSFYISPTMLFAEMIGRFYGGGVLELSPNEFRSLIFTYHEPTEEEFAEFIQVHKTAKGNIEQILDYGDQWLISNGHFSAEELIKIRDSWRVVRAHRLRHGSHRIG